MRPIIAVDVDTIITERNQWFEEPLVYQWKTSFSYLSVSSYGWNTVISLYALSFNCLCVDVFVCFYWCLFETLKEKEIKLGSQNIDRERKRGWIGEWKWKSKKYVQKCILDVKLYGENCSPSGAPQIIILVSLAIQYLWWVEGEDCLATLSK